MADPAMPMSIVIMQPTGSFKIRGATNKVRLLDGPSRRAGVLTASGLIAGESVFGLIWAAFIATGLAASQNPLLQTIEGWARRITAAQFFEHPSYLVGGLIVMAGLAALMIWLPLTSAGDPNEPAPPTAMM